MVLVAREALTSEVPAALEVDLADREAPVDPVVLASRIVLALQTIVSRENNPLDPLVVTIGSIHGGTQGNVIPDEVKLELSVRTFTEELQRKVLAAITRIARAAAQVHHHVVAGRRGVDHHQVVALRGNLVPHASSEYRFALRFTREAALQTESGGSGRDHIQPFSNVTHSRSFKCDIAHHELFEGVGGAEAKRVPNVALRIRVQ